MKFTYEASLVSLPEYIIIITHSNCEFLKHIIRKKHKLKNLHSEVVILTKKNEVVTENSVVDCLTFEWTGKHCCYISFHYDIKL